MKIDPSTPAQGGAVSPSAAADLPVKARTSLWRRLPLLLLPAAGIAFVVLANDPYKMLAELAANGGWLRGMADRWGFVSVLAYIAGYAALMTTLWVPAWVCSVVGGFLFGAWLGTLYALLGATFGSIAVYWLVRSGAGITRRPGGLVMRRFEAGLISEGFLFLIFVRLIPIIPFAAINLAAAFLAVPLHAFVAATMLGIAPSTIVYAGLGNGLKDGFDAASLSHPNLMLPLAGVVALALLAFVGRSLLRRRRGW